MTGSHDVFAATKASDSFGDVGEEIITGRKYIVVRAIGDTAVSALPPVITTMTADTLAIIQEEKGSEAQKRIIGDFYATVENYDAN